MKKRAQCPANIDWGRVAHLIRKSFTGYQITETDHDYLVVAWKNDRERYNSVGARVREEERDLLRRH